MPHNSPPPSILSLLEDQIIPEMGYHKNPHLILASEQRHKVRLVEGAHTSEAQKLGLRQAMRGQRRCGNTHIVTAQWLEEEQEVLRIPMLHYIAAGEADIRFGEYILHCQQGHCVVVPPGVPHPGGHQVLLEGERRKNGQCTVLTLSPRGRQMQCWIAYSQRSTFSVGENLFILSELLANYLDHIVEELVAAQPKASKIAHHLLLALWNTLQRELMASNYLDFRNADPTLNDSLASHTTYDPIAHAQRYIQSHLGQTLTLESVAQAVHLSRTQFARRFKEQTGQTLIEYVNQRRLQRACAFLVETDWTINYISRFVGFKSPSYFHTFFRREMGVSPVEYRKSTFIQPSSPKKAR